ncbi:hypothetical protein MTBUT4_180092 [Magnetospirillum sp. UT-4]|nr:hypothetical protein MTBUT4_180092 [Magnetospirillum sp. UT-4]
MGFPQFLMYMHHLWQEGHATANDYPGPEIDIAAQWLMQKRQGAPPHLLLRSRDPR